MLLLLTHVPGIKHCANGACRWVTLGPLNFQPAELVKLSGRSVATLDETKRILWPQGGLN